MQPILASMAEAKLGALFLNAQHACPLCIALEELGHKHPLTPIQTDNTTATGIDNNNIKQKQSKSINMSFYWIWDRVHQGHYHIFWHLSNTNQMITPSITLMPITSKCKQPISMLLPTTLPAYEWMTLTPALMRGCL